jgi:hypothetical protein
MAKTSADLLRTYLDIMDEAVRMAYTRDTDGKIDAVRPRTQDQRNQLAQAARQSRQYNKQMKDYVTQPHAVPAPDDPDPKSATIRARGTQSGNIVKTVPSGYEVDTGPEVSIAGAPETGTWAARALDTQDPRVKWSGQVAARDGKPGQLRKPQI